MGNNSRMNPKLKGLVKRFSERKKINENLSTQYEYFANYLLLKEEFYKVNWEYPFDSILNYEFLKGINFGENSTMSVDGCFIFYENEIIHLDMEDKEIDDFLNKIKKGKIYLTLIQTKSGKLETEELSTLSNLLDNLFDNQESWKKLIKFREKYEELIMENQSVEIEFSVVYVTGDRIDNSLLSNPNFKVRENSLQKAMENFFWINNSDFVKINYFDDAGILKLYEQQGVKSNVISKTVKLERMTDEISINGEGKIRFGAISFGELLKILYNEEKKRPNDIYGYNVRGEIEQSPINQHIKKSIENNNAKFLLLNNGITMVVDKQDRKGDVGIYLENIQIVNGCQTSHTILKTCLGNDKYFDIKVPVKIIERSENDAILGEITFSSNNQNPITKDNMLSIHPHMFELEKKYKDFELTNKNEKLIAIFFERRQGQYNNTSALYIDMLELVKAYLCLWQKKPHFAAMYRDTNIEEFKGLLEKDDNFINKALIAGILWFNIFKKIDVKYENARYHIYTIIAIHKLSKLSRNELYNISSDDFLSLLEKQNNFNEQILEDIEITKEDISYLINNVIAKKRERFPINENSGKFNYKDFYKVDALVEFYDAYKDPLAGF